MSRKTGYLASISLIPTLPPLIFRFQFNPELMSEKKSYRYREANAFGAWGFDQYSAASGFFDTFTGIKNDVYEIGSLLIATKPMEALEGDQRTFSIDFSLDASVPGPLDGTTHYGSDSYVRNSPDDNFNGSIEPDLAVLRSFMVPTLDVVEIAKMFASGFKDIPCLNRPPACNLFYGGLSVTCVTQARSPNSPPSIGSPTCRKTWSAPSKKRRRSLPMRRPRREPTPAVPRPRVRPNRSSRCRCRRSRCRCRRSRPPSQMQTSRR